MCQNRMLAGSTTASVTNRVFASLGLLLASSLVLQWAQGVTGASGSQGAQDAKDEREAVGGSGLPATRPAPWPVSISNAQTLRVYDGEALRLRPWVSDALPRAKQIEALRPQHRTTLVVEDYLLKHLDQTALKVNASSSDFPKVDGQVVTFGEVVIRRIVGYDVRRTRPGVHLDLIWVRGSDEPGVLPDCTIEDVWGYDLGPGCMTILQDGGSWDTFTVRRCVFADNASPAAFKGLIRTLVFEDSPGLRAYIDSKQIERVVVRRCPGHRITRGDGGPAIIYEDAESPARGEGKPQGGSSDAPLLSEDHDVVIGGRKWRLVPVE